MSQRNKIYHFIFDSRPGGVLTYIENIQKNIENKGFSFYFIYTGRKNKEGTFLINIRKISKILFPLEQFINIILLSISVISGTIKRKEIIFQIHSVSNLFPLVVAYIFRIPTIWHIHESAGKIYIFKIGNFFYKKIKNRQVVVVAYSCARNFSINGFNLIPSSIDHNYWNLNKSKIKQTDFFKIVAIGNVNYIKGHDILLESLLLTDLDFELKIVGAFLETQKEQTKKVQFLAEKLKDKKPSSKITFTGFKAKDEIKDILAQSDIHITPSRSESSPLALLEAMSCGCVCIASNVGGISEIINEENGIIVDLNTSKIKEAIENVSNMDKVKLKKISDNAKKTVKINHSIEVNSSKMIEIYNNL